ncbi:MAG: hypothetical protein WC894_05220 [Patescibacteria group bacterium]
MLQRIKKNILKIPFLAHPLICLNTMLITGSFSNSSLTFEKKAELLVEIAKKYNLKILVETGTHKGDTMYYCKDYFDELFSIELDHEFYIYSKNKLSNYKNVHIVEGDSGVVLVEILKNINKPVLFWLDAHYSGVGTAKGDFDTPVIKELDYILNKNLNCVILIDDARLFRGRGRYPQLKSIKKMLKKYSDYKIEVRNDIIRIYIKN